MPPTSVAAPARNNSQGTHTTTLARQIEQIAQDVGAEAVAAAYYDLETHEEWLYNGDEWFHAASTIKVPILLAVFHAIEEGKFGLESKLHVRNRFRSVATGKTYKVSSGRDANSAVHKALGKTMKIEDLARHMIVTSSNLATNLLLDLVGVENAKAFLASLEIGGRKLDGIALERGVEDEEAFEKGINNRVTAAGLVRLLRTVEEEGHFTETSRERMLDILHQQEFNSGIPAGLPDKIRVAHKTGEISTVAHDTGIVYPEGREPYSLAVLTQWQPDKGHRMEAVSRISKAIYSHLTGGDSK